MPFDTNKIWVSGDLSARFLPRKDARGLYLGQHTNCCQHPNGAGSSCTWYGQESPNSGFFVVENSKNEIIAQSWVWISDDGGVCFDNCEAKGVGSNEDIVLNLYQQVAKELSKNYHIVTIGASGDLHIHNLNSVDNGNILRPPYDYSGYHDSSSQKLLARNPLPKRKLSDKDVWVRGALEIDKNKTKEIA
jgi:hypothetical protein